MATGIKELHQFIIRKLKTRIQKSYLNFEILSEADLEAFVCYQIKNFIKELPRTDLTVHCEPSIKTESGRIHPDVVIFKQRSPWVLIELKETWKRIKVESAEKEKDRLINCKKLYGARRGYILYVSRSYRRNQPHKALPQRKGSEARRFLFEIGIVMENTLAPKEYKIWNEEFKRRARTNIPTVR